MSVNYKTAEEKLNAFMDEQLQKGDEMDCDAVAECADMLLMMENDLSFLPAREKVCANVDAIYREAHPKKLGKTVKIILVAAAITLLLVVSSLAYCQFRYDIFDFLDHSTVSFPGEPGEVSGLTVGYIPEEYNIINETKQTDRYAFVYKNEDANITITKDNWVAPIDFDTEHSGYKEIEMDGTIYFISGDDSFGRGVIWSANSYRYQVNGMLTEEEILKIARSVE